VSQLQDKVLRDRDFFIEFLDDLSINVTEMFRDPAFYKALREKIIPKLKTYTYSKIWHAGCFNRRRGLFTCNTFTRRRTADRCQVYATDFSRKVLDIAKEGIYQKSEIEQYEKNYELSGGKRSYPIYKSRYGSVIFDKELSEKLYLQTTIL